MRVSLGRTTGLLALLALACSEATGPNSAGLTPGELSPVKTSAEATMTIAQGDGQFAQNSNFTSIDPAIQLRDLGGNPIANEPITFTVSNASARVGIGSDPQGTSYTTNTNSSGVAIARWKLGTNGGQTLQAQAGNGGVLVTFRGIATSNGSAPVFVKAQGDGAGQNDGQMRGHPARTNPTVTVQDGAAVVLPNVDVTWTASGNGSASPPTSATGTNGNASTVWTFGTATGAHTMTARMAAGPPGTQLQNVTPAVFTVTPLAQGTSMTKLQGDNQTAVAVAGTKIGPKDPTVQIAGVAAGVQVKFTFGAGTDDCNSNTVKFVATNADGIAATAWCLTGTTLGSKSLTAVAGSFSATFTASATVGTANAIAKVQGDNCSGQVASTCSPDPTVRVTDVNGNGVDGYVVTFNPSGDGVATNGTNSGGLIQVTTANGGYAAARWTLGTTSGAQTMEASGSGGLTTTFNATATAGPSTSITKINGDDFVGPANTQTTKDPTVQVKDQYGNAKNGVVIEWVIVTPSSARVTPTSLCGGTTTATSNTTGCTDGRAAALWTFGTAGTQQLKATVQGTALSVTFNGIAQ